MLLLLAALLLSVASGAKIHKKYNTGFKRTTDGRVNVHIVPASHCDVGWLKTVDQYYYGANNTIQHANVHSILDAMIGGLVSNPDRKYIEVEQAFFQRWWAEQTPDMQNTVQGLVARGQLEFINGAWSMHDEASPTFVDMLDNTHLGGRLIWQSFGVSPKTTWQIDPFGHSTFQGTMLSSPLSGVNGVYVARMDYQDVTSMRLLNATEMFWTSSPSLPNLGGMLGLMPFYYYAPEGFDFGGADNTQPIMDDESLEDYNVPDRIAAFNALIDSAMQFTRGSDIMIQMATDFSGENAPVWYNNIDKLVHYASTPGPWGGGKYNVMYSTPSIYTSAKIASTPLPRRTEDVFPYADNPHGFWSGYFCSRPALKGYIRDSSTTFQVAKQLQAFTAPPASMEPSNPLYLLERAMGVTQHHDGVSGTSKQHVAYDYALRLAKGRLSADALITQALARLTGHSATPFVSCDLANATICPATEAPGGGLALALYNQQSTPLAQHTVRIPIASGSSGAFTVTDVATGAVLRSQTLPLTPDDLALRTGYYGVPLPGPMVWLAFTLPAVPAMGLSVVLLQPSAAPAAPAAPAVSPALTDITLSNGLVSLTFNASTGLLSSFNGQPFSLTFQWWNSSTGSHSDDGTGSNSQISGAYIFRPNGTTPFQVAAGPVQLTQTGAGPAVWEVVQVFADWAVAKVRLHANSSAVEVEWTIGPIPFADGMGKEVFARYDAGPGFASGGAWVSDSNGRDALTRVRNHRSSWNYTVVEPIAGNFVPVNLFQTISSGAATVSIVTDRTQAGASLQDGALDFMVHRRLMRDDNRGVGEPLNETGVNGAGLIVRGRHWVSMDAAAQAGRSTRALAAASLFKPHWSVAPYTGTAAAWVAGGAVGSASGLRAPLPPNLHLVTVHAQGPNTLLLRVAHMFAVGEDATLSAPASVDLATLFTAFTITAAQETILPGTMPLAQAPQSTYSVDGGGVYTLPEVYPAPAGPGLTVTVRPMEIRTFNCTFQ